MKKKQWYKVLLLPVFLSFCSCFQIIEEISINLDGSGQYRLTLNLSQSKTKVASIMVMDSLRGHNVPNKQEIRENLTKTVAFLKNTPGVTKVTKSLDLDNYIASIAFSFSNISKLNNLTKSILVKNDLNYSNPSVFSFLSRKGIFIRKFTSLEKGERKYARLSEADKEMFKKAEFVNIVRFDREIGSFTNQNAKISPSKKAIMLQCSVTDIVSGSFSISNKITLKNN